MSAGRFFWLGQSIGFRSGESVASALMRAIPADLGADANGSELRYFCGIGACQNCLVVIDGTVIESCLTPAADGQVVAPPGGAND